MESLDELKAYLKEGQVYRRSELDKWSHSAVRHLPRLVQEGFIQKLFRGTYYRPRLSVFGPVPIEDAGLLHAFLKDEPFLLMSRNLYNGLGVGTTQLYNERKVYHRHRQGRIVLANRHFDFEIRRDFPDSITVEFLLVDLARQLDTLAEDQPRIERNLLNKAVGMDKSKLREALDRYGNPKASQLLGEVLR